MSNDAYRKTLGRLAEIIGVDLPEGINADAEYGRVLTQCEYVTDRDVVISAGWYGAKRIIDESLAKNAALIICAMEDKKNYPQANVIGIDNPLGAVQAFERHMLEPIKAKTITISGSVGKTTTTGLINSVISHSFNTFYGDPMANSHGAILRNIQALTPDKEYWVQEVGGVQPGYIESTAKIIGSDIVVLTNIGESHLNTYFTKENIFYDKSSLERYAKPDATVIVCYDDEILRNAEYSHRVVTCSISDSNADIYAKNITTTFDGVCFTAVCDDGEYEVKLSLYGEYNVYNALFAIAVGRVAGLDMDKILEPIHEYKPSGMRQNFVNIGGYRLMIDAFNAEPKTVLGSAVTLTQIPKPRGRKIFVTGHIDKLGEGSEKMHEELGHELGRLDLDKIVLFAGDSKYTYKGIVDEGYKNAELMGSRDELDDWLRRNVTRDDIVFFKSGQFEAALVKSVDHVFGTTYQNEQQYNNGEVVEKDGFLIRIRRDDIAEIEKYIGNSKDVIIPSECNGATVLRIRPKAFSGNQVIESVVMPDSIVNIEYEAFYDCRNLRSVKLPKNLKIIGKNVFNHNKKLCDISLPDGVIHLDRHAFFDCTSIGKLRIPDTVGFLGVDVFGFSPGLSNDGLDIEVGKSKYVKDYLNECSIEFNKNVKKRSLFGWLRK